MKCQKKLLPWDMLPGAIAYQAPALPRSTCIATCPNSGILDSSYACPPHTYQLTCPGLVSLPDTRTDWHSKSAATRCRRSVRCMR